MGKVEKKNILITGATGFLGSHIIQKINKTDKYNPIPVKRSFSDTWRINNILSDIKYYDIDIIDIEKVFDENKIDVVIHTATDYGKYHSDFFKTTNTNLLFPLKILNLCIKYNTETFINSDTVLCKKTNAYSLSKSQFNDWLEYVSNKIKIINLKLEHFYGPKSNSDNFIAKMIRLMLDNKNIDLTKGNQKRNFVYIDDMANAFDIVLKKLDTYKKPYNSFWVGSEQNISIKELVDLMHQLTQSSSKLNYGALPYRNNELMESEINLKTKLNNWNSRFSIKEGLLETIIYEKEKVSSLKK